MADLSSARRAAAGLTFVMLIGSGCAGPEAPLRVAAREVPTDVLLTGGDEESSVSAPLPTGDLTAVGPSTRRPGSGADLVPPPKLDGLPVTAPNTVPARPPTSRPRRERSSSGTSTTTAPPPSTCPAADPLAAPRIDAPTTLLDPPWPDQVYPYRNEGTFEIGGSNASQGALPASSTRTVRSVRVVHPPGTSETVNSYQFDVVVAVEATTTTTTYLLIPEAAAGQSGVAEAGLFIDRVVTQARGTVTVFDPVPDLMLLRLPIVRGDSWNAAGADPSTGETIVFMATVGNQTVDVDACGNWLLAWPVTIDGSFGPDEGLGGTLSPGTGSQTEFRIDFAFATGYGPLSVHDITDVRVFEPNATSHRHNRSTISRAPAPACKVVVVGSSANCEVRQ